MRTMKRVAAVALSVVVLMTSGVSAKAAVTDVQPAKSSSEAVLKWQWPEKGNGQAYQTISAPNIIYFNANQQYLSILPSSAYLS